jgi:hypothetical protein
MTQLIGQNVSIEDGGVSDSSAGHTGGENIRRNFRMQDARSHNSRTGERPQREHLATRPD